MPMRYKVDVLDALKKAGYTTTQIRREKLIAEGVLTNLRKSAPISLS